MKSITNLFILFLSFFLMSGCVSFQAVGEIQKGRYDLLTGNPDRALNHFQRAAEIDPNYITDFSPL